MSITITATEARANLYRLMDQAAQAHQPIRITGKRTNAILISEADWEAIQETLYLTSVPGMRESIKEGMAEPLEKSAKELNIQYRLVYEIFAQEHIVRILRMWTHYD